MAYRRFGTSGASAVDIAVARIRQRIRDGDYVPGQRLLAGEISAELDISGGPIREALTRLAGEGLVDVQPHRGAVVKTQNEDDVAEIFELREMIEGLAASLCAKESKRTPARVKGVVEAARRCRERAQKADYLGYAAANEAFHSAIYALAGKQRVEKLARQLSDQVDRLSNRRLGHQSVLENSSAEHDLIVAAILAGDDKGAEEAMRQHVRRSGQAALGTRKKDTKDGVRRKIRKISEGASSQ